MRSCACPRRRGSFVGARRRGGSSGFGGAIASSPANRAGRSLAAALLGFGLAVAIALCGAVLFVGVYSGGARRWLDLGFTTFQPSEAIKLPLAIVLAASRRPRDFLWLACAVGGLALLYERAVKVGALPTAPDFTVI